MSTTTHTKPIHFVAVFFVDEADNFSVLLGLKTRGYGKGKIMPPGGHLSSEDGGDAIRAARREGREETGLTGNDGRVIAKLQVFIGKDHTTINVEIVVFESWTGKVKPSDEFEWLRFIPFSEIPWDQMLPGEKEWMTEVLHKKQQAIVRIECGNSRENLIASPIITLLSFQPGH